MTSNPTVEAYGRLWAQHLASSKRNMASTACIDRRKTPSTPRPLRTIFTFHGPTPDIKKPQIIFFGGSTTANKANIITAKLHLEPPRVPAPRPWNYCLFGSVLPRLHGRDIYKRAGFLAQSPSNDPEYMAAERELAKIQTGPRKRTRYMSFFQHHVDSAASILWDLSSLEAVLEPSYGLQALEDARSSIFQHYVVLHQHNLPVPKLIEHHTWHGSIDIERMTITPRKRLYNSEPIVRYEEAQFELECHKSTSVWGDKKFTKDYNRHIRPCRRAPRLSTVDECTEHTESPRRDNVTPCKSLVSRLSSAGQRTTISPWRFTFMSPSQATNEGHGTPSKFPATHDYGSPVSAKVLSPMRAAAMLRTPDCFSLSPIVAARLQQQASPITFDKPGPPIDRTTPVHLASPDTRRNSTPTKKHRGRRRSSLTATRLLAISEIAHNPVASTSSLIVVETFPVTVPAENVSLVDVTTDHESPIKDNSVSGERGVLVENLVLPHAETNTAADFVACVEISEVPAKSGFADDEVTISAEPTHNEPEEVGSISVVQSNATEADLIGITPSTSEAGSAVPANANFHMVDVDLRKNLDIFGHCRETSSHSSPLSSPVNPPFGTTIGGALDTFPKSDDCGKVGGDVLDEDDDDDDITNSINHEQINDTIALKLPDTAVDSYQNADEDKAVHQPMQSILSPDRDQEESEDEHREHLQSFLDRIKADKSAKAVKLKRRSGSLGTSAAGSPIRRAESGSADESGSKRQPLGEKSPNMSPSPTKKRKTVEDEISSGILQVPSLEDHSPPKPKRRRKNAEIESDGILNPEFQTGAQPPRRSARTRRNLLPSAPSANGFAMSKLPVIRSTAADDGGFGGSPSNATVRNDDRQLQATTRANTRRNKAGALHASDALNLQAKRSLSGGDGEEDEGSAAAISKRVKTNKSGSAKSVRWSTPLASYQEPPVVSAPIPSSCSADELVADDDETSQAPAPSPAVTVTAAPTTAPATRRRTASRLPPPTPVKKPTSMAAGRVNKPSTLAAPRTSAQLATASAAKEDAARLSAAMAADAKKDEKKKKAPARSRIGTPAAAATTKRRAARAA